MMRGCKGEIPAAHRVSALLLPGDGKSVGPVAEFLFPAPDTIHAWLPGVRGRCLASVPGT